ncbi:DUF3617 family protein [Phenylobacterium sp.]|uniref:DUF3617 domain-containing protein n=1 Tax=Phenylobacterium sp. TaxID=1871053 RepID=UPI002811CE58|nr:DUF3617 family protein [Phenylobacterium sp.]
MTRLILVALLASAAPVVALAAAQPPIQPGYWESTNKLLSPIRQTKVERRCITPADVDKFLAGPSNRHYKCAYPHKIIAGGKISLKGTCVSKKGRKVEVEGSGAYNPTSFNLTASIATEFLGLDIAGKASTEARRIGDVCPAPETPPPAEN